jgi:hypothetical protein
MSLLSKSEWSTDYKLLEASIQPRYSLTLFVAQPKKMDKPVFMEKGRS